MRLPSNSCAEPNVRWLPDEGLTPGWDLQYENEAGELIGVEVKGTTDPTFANVELTAGEWQAACTLG
jgi:Protein NO VEIN, C-terminal